jgi:O-antigen/teichoic acid export membrane protein
VTFVGGLTRNFLANYFGLGWSAIMAIAFLPFYVDRLGLEAYGLIGFFAVMQSILALFDLGLAPTLTREAASISANMLNSRNIRDLLRSIECISFVIALALVLVIFTFAETIATNWIRSENLSVSDVVYFVRVMSFVFAARLLEGIYRGILIGLERQVRFNILNACVSTIRYAGAAIILDIVSEPLNAFFLWQAAISLVSLATVAKVAYTALPVAEDRVDISLAALQKVWRFSAGMTAVSITSLVVTNLDKFLLSGVLTLNEFGQYSLASVAASLLYTLLIPITLSVYPRLVINHVDRNLNGTLITYRISSQLAASVAGSAGLCLAFFSMEVIYVWSGNINLAKAVSPLLKILALAALANCFGHIGINLMQARGNTLVMLCINCFVLLCSVIFLQWIARKHGINSAAIFWCGIAFIQATITLILANICAFNRLGCRQIFNDLISPMLGAFAVCCAAYLVRPDLTSSRVHVGIFLMFAGGAAVVLAILCTKELRTLFFNYIDSKNTQI